MTHLSIIIPAFNEEANIAAVVARTRSVLDGLDVSWTITFVDDGSRDSTVERIRVESVADSRIGCLVLSRNFGKEIAIAAGLSAAKGDAVVIMDADLQHPPETIIDFLAAWRQGAEVVLGQRIDAPDASRRRQLASNMFYPVFRMMAGMSLEAGTVDFVLLDRKAVDALNRFGERSRFTKGLFHWIGFRTVIIPFDCGVRTGGQSSFNFRRLLRFALDGIISFSSWPLRIWSWVGAIVSASSIIYALYFLLRTLIHGADVPGFPSLIVSITFLSGIQLLSLGVIGEYLSRIYDEVKARPLFLIREEIGNSSQPDVNRTDTAA
ncbi:glycosyltransferase family 2 protein [Allorhizobium sp. BGMRC 0089]|uniref:glycosyltransferase family 2 protein n=1 Tax=Allorhizobium sonneratiae TaxID=2934936 RepID=UPI0020341B1F|nr:glycosyltransferase family 2 protein [Allorhizobium sonneratiae]MCM2294285.1 glycosyltransferase family 2 protein [Allorhizobium sonneratiae]